MIILLVVVIIKLVLLFGSFQNVFSKKLLSSEHPYR